MKHSEHNAESPARVTAEEWANMTEQEKLAAVHDHRVDPVLMFETVGADAIKQLLTVPKGTNTVRIMLDGELQGACFTHVIEHLEALGAMGGERDANDPLIRYEICLKSKNAGEGEQKKKDKQEHPDQLNFLRELAEKIRDHPPTQRVTVEELTATEQGREALEAVFSALDGVGNFFRGSSRPEPVARAESPENLPQPTFTEMRYASIAIADGRTGRGWSSVPGETALIHRTDGETHHAKFTVKPEQNWWGEATVTHEHLREQLRTLEPAGALCMQVVTAWAIEQDRVTVTLNDIIRLIGWTPRSTAEREEMQRKVWIWLELFNGITIHGKRPGTYRDPITKKVIDLTSSDAFIAIVGRRDAQHGQYTFDKGHPPVEVSWVAGPWVDAHRHSRNILTDFGNVLALTGLPIGKPSGAWALSIGLALNQKWRELASRAEEHQKYSTNVKTGETTKKLTVSFDRPFTRYELLDMLRPEPWVEDVLKSSDPKRAQKYWDDAIKLLKARIIGDYKVLDPMPVNRKGWQSFWLKEQRILILPKQQGVEAVAEIAQRTRSINKAVKRKRN